jgi:hypothetical protein
MVDDRVVGLTRHGRRALQTGLDGLSAETQLAIELIACTGDITEDHLAELIDQCIAHYGSTDRALLAIKTGRARVQPDDQNALREVRK